MQGTGTSILAAKLCLRVTRRTMLAETMSGLDIVLMLDALPVMLSCTGWYPRYQLIDSVLGCLP
jgi:hypothetical protein